MTPRGHPPSCELTGVKLAYGDVTAVADLSLRVAPGETVALVGPSGAGKTSLLRMLAGMLPASSGTVCLQGQPVDGLSGDLPRLVGMMQQRLELVGELAVKHNVQAGALGRWGVLRSLAALLLPLEYPPARAAAERVGLTDKFGVRVARLSGGEQQRVALARLLVQDPAVMLADEPVAALDPALAEDLVALLCALAREGDRTLVASLHTPELARAHFDRLVGLRAGQLTFDLPSDQVGAGDLAALYERASPAPAASSPSGDGLARNAPQGDDARR
jgi:phosphonate transport system ATP-binding protein